MVNEIRFYSTRGKHGCFSNFSKHSVHIDGLRWPTTEHYFQAMKFEGSKKDYLDVFHSKGASEAARLGRDRKRPLRKDWEVVKEDVMRKALLAKFTQNSELNKILLNTNKAIIIEETHRDHYWGNGGDDTGKNRLGCLLMELRTRIQSAESDSTNTDKYELNSIDIPSVGITTDPDNSSSLIEKVTQESSTPVLKLRKKKRLQDGQANEKRKPSKIKNKWILQDD